MDVESRLLKILREKLEVSEAVDIKPEYSLQTLDINSVSFVKLVVEIEKEFGFEFQDDSIDMNKLSTVKNLIEFIEENCENAGG